MSQDDASYEVLLENSPLALAHSPLTIIGQLKLALLLTNNGQWRMVNGQLRGILLWQRQSQQTSAINHPEHACRLINPGAGAVESQLRQLDQRRKGEEFRVVATDNSRLLLIIVDRRPKLIRLAGRLKIASTVIRDWAEIAAYWLRRAGLDIEQVTVRLWRQGAAVNY